MCLETDILPLDNNVLFPEMSVALPWLEGAVTAEIDISFSEILYGLWGVRDRVVRVVDFESLAPHRCGVRISTGTTDSFM